MRDHASFARRGATRLLIGPLAALCLVVPVLAGPGERPDETARPPRSRRSACLHYRFVERDLILVDSVAQLIVDILPAAAPDLAIK
jgi:hypothetical protein